MVKPIPDGYHTITLSLVLSPCSEAIAWYERVFGAEEVARMPTPEGKIMHAELKIGDSPIMLMDPMMGSKGPKELGGTNATVHVYVADADALWTTALAAGATPVLNLHDAFWGDRYGIFVDPFGQQWSVATHREDLTPEEVSQRAAALFSGG